MPRVFRTINAHRTIFSEWALRALLNLSAFVCIGGADVTLRPARVAGCREAVEPQMRTDRLRQRFHGTGQRGFGRRCPEGNWFSNGRFGWGKVTLLR